MGLSLPITQDAAAPRCRSCAWALPIRWRLQRAIPEAFYPELAVAV
ncbi:hypothetical protein [Synechococcus sp. 1G10]|nr:hypothetical protein [Synechococcus sp. 1G10]